jgi:hypothetical protein
VVFDPPKRLHASQLEQLIGRGIVKETMEGRYWFDREAYSIDQQRRTAAAKRMLVIIAIGSALVIAVAAIVRFLH